MMAAIVRLILVCSAATCCVVATAGPSAAACGTTVTMDNAAETCEVAGSGALPTLAGAKGPEVHLVPVCAVRVGIACGRPLNCTASDGTRGIFYAVHVDGTLTGQRCIGDGEANDAGVITPGQVRRAFQRLDWPASPLIIQPPDGLTLVNFDTNFEVPPGP